MTIADANAVSERITRTVLDLLGLTRGTLFLHDPRVERYVVSYSNDPSRARDGRVSARHSARPSAARAVVGTVVRGRPRRAG